MAAYSSVWQLMRPHMLSEKYSLQSAYDLLRTLSGHMWCMYCHLLALSDHIRLMLGHRWSIYDHIRCLRGVLNDIWCIELLMIVFILAERLEIAAIQARQIRVITCIIIGSVTMSSLECIGSRLLAATDMCFIDQSKTCLLCKAT